MKKIDCSLIWTLIFCVKNVVIGWQVSSSLSMFDVKTTMEFLWICANWQKCANNWCGKLYHNWRAQWRVRPDCPGQLSLSTTPWVAYPSPDPFSGVFSILFAFESLISDSEATNFCNCRCCKMWTRKHYSDPLGIHHHQNLLFCVLTM
jgi:hypothetical protein